MPMSCAAYGCTQRHCTNLEQQNKVSFHKFPLQNPGLLKLWILAVKRKNWNPSVYSRICSDHFNVEDFITARNIKILKKDAVPTIFNFQLHRQKAIKRRRVFEKQQKSQDEVLLPHSSSSTVSFPSIQPKIDLEILSQSTDCLTETIGTQYFQDEVVLPHSSSSTVSFTPIQPKMDLETLSQSTDCLTGNFGTQNFQHEEILPHSSSSTVSFTPIQPKMDLETLSQSTDCLTGTIGTQNFQHEVVLPHSSSSTVSFPPIQPKMDLKTLSQSTDCLTGTIGTQYFQVPQYFQHGILVLPYFSSATMSLPSKAMEMDLTNFPQSKDCLTDVATQHFQYKNKEQLCFSASLPSTVQSQRELTNLTQNEKCFVHNETQTSLNCKCANVSSSRTVSTQTSKAVWFDPKTKYLRRKVHQLQKVILRKERKICSLQSIL